jgi:hypothetical protein
MNLFGKAFKALVVFVVLFIIATMVFTRVITPRYPNRYGYALLYNIQPDKVKIQDRPQNCDWGWAPTGDKGCHYEKQVSAFDANSNYVPLDQSQGHVRSVEVTWKRVEGTK